MYLIDSAMSMRVSHASLIFNACRYHVSSLINCTDCTMTTREKLLLTRDGTDKLRSYLNRHLLGQVFLAGHVAVRAVGYNDQMTQCEVEAIVVDDDVRHGNMPFILASQWKGKNCMQLDIGQFGQPTLCKQDYLIYTPLSDWSGKGTEWTMYNRHLEWKEVLRYA